MRDKFNRELLDLALTSPELQEAIAKTITSPVEYSIPTRTWELEDARDRLPTGQTIHRAVVGIEDAEQRERAIEKVKQADSATVRDLAIRLNILSIAYTLKEAEGKTLTPQEKTLKDLDITALAYTLLNINTPKQAYETFNSAEEYEEARAKIIGKN